MTRSVEECEQKEKHLTTEFTESTEKSRTRIRVLCELCGSYALERGTETAKPGDPLRRIEHRQSLLKSENLRLPQNSRHGHHCADWERENRTQQRKLR